MQNRTNLPHCLLDFACSRTPTFVSLDTFPPTVRPLSLEFVNLAALNCDVMAAASVRFIQIKIEFPNEFDHIILLTANYVPYLCVFKEDHPLRLQFHVSHILTESLLSTDMASIRHLRRCLEIRRLRSTRRKTSLYGVYTDASYNRQIPIYWDFFVTTCLLFNPVKTIEHW